MKKLVMILIAVIGLAACEKPNYQLELVEGQCYIFEPPVGFINHAPDTIWIVEKYNDFVLVQNNKQNQFKMKYEGFSEYLRQTNLCNCKYGNN